MTIPKYVQKVIESLEKAGFEAYVVGGCVRDLLMGKEPKDWDITTNARPEEILKVFPFGKYENSFGTVLVSVKNLGPEHKDSQEAVEITTYRSEQGYSDRRHPDKVIFEQSLDKDLSRRDFTVNALAMKNKKSKIKIKEDIRKYCFEFNGFYIIDLFGGQKDIKKKIIRAVGEPVDRFREDALRMMRAIRLACQLEFEIEAKTERGIKKMAGSIKFIAKERIRDELIKILESDRAYEGIMLLHKTGLLKYILPELEAGVGVSQGRHHTYTVFKHNILSLKHCPSRDWRVRLTALLHDVGKPKTRKIIKGQITFYNHETVGAHLTKKITQRLRLSRKDSEKIITLIRNHMFYYNVGEVTESSVRRLIRKVGEENLRDLINLRIADRLGSGVPKAKPYKLRHLEYMMKKVRHDPISVKMLKINGDDLMKILEIKPGPKIGAILDVLLSEVIDNPSRNTRKYLTKRSKELNKMDLEDLRKEAKEKIKERQEEEDKKMKKEFWVK